MRREGRQRGMVRTFPVLSAENNPRPRSGRSLNELRSPPTAGLFTKAPSRPTNHSKFTGKCGRPKCRDCHIEPAGKSKAKAKGTHKSRTTTPSDIGLLAAVGPATAGVDVCGFSATDVLEHLDDDGFGCGDFLECFYYDDKFSSPSLVSCC